MADPSSTTVVVLFHDPLEIINVVRASSHNADELDIDPPLSHTALFASIVAKVLSQLPELSDKVVLVSFHAPLDDARVYLASFQMPELAPNVAWVSFHMELPAPTLEYTLFQLPELSPTVVNTLFQLPDVAGISPKCESHIEDIPATVA